MAMAGSLREAAARAAATRAAAAVVARVAVLRRNLLAQRRQSGRCETSKALQKTTHTHLNPVQTRKRGFIVRRTFLETIVVFAFAIQGSTDPIS